MKLSQQAKNNSLTYKTAYIHFREGKIPNARQLSTGTIIVDEEKNENKKEYTIVYTRVSSSKNKSNLETQTKRVLDFCAAKGFIVNEVIQEIGSSLNDNRQKLLKIFKEKKATRIVIEHKDRLTRFGFNYIKYLFNGEIITINDIENDKEDLMQDFISIITSFCARIYGNRRVRRKTEQIIKQLNNND